MDVPYGTACYNCWTRSATGIWIGEGSGLDYVHGGGVPWCRRCMVEAQLVYARAVAAKIPALETELAGLP